MRLKSSSPEWSSILGSSLFFDWFKHEVDCKTVILGLGPRIGLADWTKWDAIWGSMEVVIGWKPKVFAWYKNTEKLLLVLTYQSSVGDLWLSNGSESQKNQYHAYVYVPTWRLAWLLFGCLSCGAELPKFRQHQGFCFHWAPLAFFFTPPTLSKDLPYIISLSMNISVQWAANIIVTSNLGKVLRQIAKIPERIIL